MKDIIVNFNEKSKELIDELESVKQFKKEFAQRQDVVDNFKANNDSLYKLMHPIKLIKNCCESRRLNTIKKDYDFIYDSNVLLYVMEETGDLQQDLENATYKVKPNHMDRYVKSIKLKK